MIENKRFYVHNKRRGKSYFNMSTDDRWTTLKCIKGPETTVVAKVEMCDVDWGDKV